MRERQTEREILLSLAYQGKEDKKSLSLMEHATATTEVKFEIDEPWVAWLGIFKQIKASTKLIAAQVSTYGTFVLHFKVAVDAGTKECQELSLMLDKLSADL